MCISVKKASYYSVLADETKNVSRREQLSIVVKYVYVETGIVHERFLTYAEAKLQNAESLAAYILDTVMERVRLVKIHSLRKGTQSSISDTHYKIVLNS